MYGTDKERLSEKEWNLLTAYCLISDRQLHLFGAIEDIFCPRSETCEFHF
jgi:hypothetical protein